MFAVKWLSVGGAGEIAPLAGGDDDDGAGSALQDSGTTPFASAPRFAAEAGGGAGSKAGDQAHETRRIVGCRPGVTRGRKSTLHAGLGKVDADQGSGGGQGTPPCARPCRDGLGSPGNAPG